MIDVMSIDVTYKQHKHAPHTALTPHQRHTVYFTHAAPGPNVHHLQFPMLSVALLISVYGITPRTLLLALSVRPYLGRTYSSLHCTAMATRSTRWAPFASASRHLTVTCHRRLRRRIAASSVSSKVYRTWWVAERRTRKGGAGWGTEGMGRRRRRYGGIAEESSMTGPHK